MTTPSVRRVTQDSKTKAEGDSTTPIVLPPDHVKRLRAIVPSVADTAVT